MARKAKTTYKATIEVAGVVHQKTISSTLPISQVMDSLVQYVKDEGINQLGECNVKVSYSG